MYMYILCQSHKNLISVSAMLTGKFFCKSGQFLLAGNYLDDPKIILMVWGVTRWHRKSASVQIIRKVSGWSKSNLIICKVSGWSGEIQIIHKCALPFIYMFTCWSQMVMKHLFYALLSHIWQCRNLRALSGKFLYMKSFYPESFHFLWLCSGGHGGKKVIRWIFRDFRQSQEDNFNSSIFCDISTPLRGGGGSGGS